MAWFEAFTKSRGPKAVTPTEFARLEALKTYFGSQPLKTDVPGGRVNFNSKAYRYWSAYQMLEKDFAGLDESFLNAEQFERIIESTGGRPVFWKSQSGTPYMALLDVEFTDAPILRFPDVFNTANHGDPVNELWMSILEKGGVIDLPLGVPGSASGLDNVSGTVRELNDRNIKKLKEAGLIS